MAASSQMAFPQYRKNNDLPTTIPAPWPLYRTIQIPLVSQTVRILLANLLQSSRSTFSQGNLLRFFAFKEGMVGTSISVRGGWPTVTHEPGLSTAYENRGHDTLHFPFLLRSHLQDTFHFPFPLGSPFQDGCLVHMAWSCSAVVLVEGMLQHPGIACQGQGFG